MNTFPIRLEDLVPKETAFELSQMPGQKLTLCRWSLRVRAWATAKYTPQGVKDIFEQQKIEEIADMAFFMLKEKDVFGGLDSFLDNIITIQDQIAVIKALLGAVGIGEPEIQQISEAVGDPGKAKKVDPTDPKPKAPKKKIGAKSLTP